MSIVMIGNILTIYLLMMMRTRTPRQALEALEVSHDI
jgi:hypothetical protein